MKISQRVAPVLACLSAILLVPPAVAADAPKDNVPWLYRGSDVPQDREWVFGELPNGLRYAVRNNRVPPGQVSIRIRIDAGSLYERDGEEGYAHLIEHLLFRQSKYLGDGEAIPTWQRLGASFGNDTNAETTPTHTVYNGVREPVLWVFQSYFVNQIGDGVADNVARDNSIGYTNCGITIIVPRRNNGPVVQITGNKGLSIQYSGWGATYELEAFRKVNRARNLDEFRAAVLDFDVGSQNFAYADKLGNIAYFVSAEMPIREDLQEIGRAHV